jgi:hypothetical protein
MTHNPFDRQLLIKAMAADLHRLGATDSERSAIRALSSAPYRLGDVAALAEDALFEARQNAVAAEMARR